MGILAKEIKTLAYAKGSDLAGIAPVNRFQGAPDGHRPEDILENAQTVVACAKRIPNIIVVEGPATSYDYYMALVGNLLERMPCV